LPEFCATFGQQHGLTLELDRRFGDLLVYFSKELEREPARLWRSILAASQLTVRRVGSIYFVTELPAGPDPVVSAPHDLIAAWSNRMAMALDEGLLRDLGSEFSG
jgi:hypothetical protein